MIDGKTVKMGGKDWTVPPLNFKALKQFGPVLKTKTPQQLVEEGLVLDIIHAAMLRNYPDLTRDELEDMLDMGNVMEVTMTVMGASGMVAVQPGEGVAANRSTGEASTGS